MGLIGDEVKWCQLFFYFLPLAWLGSSKTAVPAGAARVGSAGKKKIQSDQNYSFFVVGAVLGLLQLPSFGQHRARGFGHPSRGSRDCCKSIPSARTYFQKSSISCVFPGLGETSFPVCRGGLTFGERCSCDGWEQGQILGGEGGRPIGRSLLRCPCASRLGGLGGEQLRFLGVIWLKAELRKPWPCRKALPPLCCCSARLLSWVSVAL